MASIAINVNFDVYRWKRVSAQRRGIILSYRDLMQQTPRQIQVFITELHLTVQGIWLFDALFASITLVFVHRSYLFNICFPGFIEVL